MTLLLNAKRIIFIVVAFTAMFLITSQEVRQILGNFAIGWLIADLSFMIFKNKE